MSTKVYFLIFAILVGSTLGEISIISLPLGQNVISTVIMALAGVKALLVALFFQHLKDEPRSLSFVVLLALAAAFPLLTITFLQIHMLHV